MLLILVLWVVFTQADSVVDVPGHPGRRAGDLIFLSITVITGMAGQISLCQGAFAAIGAFTVFQMVVSLRHVGARGRARSAR